MELRHLRYFIKAAELLNFTKAAEALYVSQPTLSVQIHQLEEELGAELFTRVGRNIRLTEPGKVFLARALQAVRAIEEGSREIEAINGIFRGHLTIGTLPLYGSRLMVAWVSSFNKAHPNVNISVKAIPSEDIEEGIIGGSIDLGLTFLPPTHSELTTNQLFDDEIVIVASTKHEFASKKNLTLSDLTHMQLALPSERISATKLLYKYLEENKLTVGRNIRMSFDDGHALLEFVKSGDFVTLLPKICIKEDEHIRTFALPKPGLKVCVGALWMHLSPAANVFLDLMTEKSKELVTESQQK